VLLRWLLGRGQWWRLLLLLLLLLPLPPLPLGTPCSAQICRAIQQQRQEKHSRQTATVNHMMVSCNRCQEMDLSDCLLRPSSTLLTQNGTAA
jgi:hypothetical protein